MKSGAKPSSGLVHLHKSFVELHFSSLPQTVAVQACIDGHNLATILPGQVYSTSCGQDHWLLGLQYIFKAYKEPVITHVDMQGDSQVLVSISSQGLQDKYTSSDPAQRAELQRALEAAAYKFAQTAVMRKEGRLQISGPNINIPKKQLRAQWPAILERLAPQDVQAHIFVDNPDSYIACAAKIILTKAKAEPVFYLSGLSQLLKSFTGAFVTLELLPEEGVVRLNIDTGQRQPSLSTTAGVAAASEAAETSSAAATPAAESQQQHQQQQQRSGQAGQAVCWRDCGEAASGPLLQTPQSHQGFGALGPVAAGTAAGSSQCGSGGPSGSAAAAAAGNAALLPADAAGDGGMRVPAAAGADMLLPAAALSCVSGHPAAGVPARPTLQRPPLQQGTARKLSQLPPVGPAGSSELPAACLMLEGMASSNMAAVAGPPAAAGAGASGIPAAAPTDSEGQVEAGSSMRPHPGTPGRSTARAPSPRHVDAAAVAAAAATSTHTLVLAAAGAPAAAAAGAAAETDAGLWLLADHAALLQARGSTGNLSTGTVSVSAEAGSREAAAVAAALPGSQMEGPAARSKRVLPGSHPARGKAREATPQQQAVAGGDGSRQPAEDMAAAQCADGWQLHPKRRRTARAAAGGAAPPPGPCPCPSSTAAAQGDLAQLQQLAHPQFYGPGLAADMYQLHGGYYYQQHAADAGRLHEHCLPPASIAAPAVTSASGQEPPAAGLLAAAAAAVAAAAGTDNAASGGGSDDVMALARQQEQQVDGGEAVAVVHRVSSAPIATVKMDADVTRQLSISQQLLQHQQGVVGHGAWPGGQQDAALYKDQHFPAPVHPAEAGRYHMCSSPGLPAGHLPLHWHQQHHQQGSYAVGFPAGMHQPGWLQPACPGLGPGRAGKPAASDAAGVSAAASCRLPQQLPLMALPHSMHDWSPATMMGSPHSGSSSVTRVTPSSTGGGCSPAAAAASAAAAAAAASGGLQHVLAPALLPAGVAAGPDYGTCDPRSAPGAEQHWAPPASAGSQRLQCPLQQPHSSRPFGGPSPVPRGAFGGSALAAGSAAGVEPGVGAGAWSHPGPAVLFNALAAPGKPGGAPGAAAAQERELAGQQQEQQEQHCWPAAAEAPEPGCSQDEARIDSHGALLLPDADNLLVVGKSLVQVMNHCGAGSEARLAVTRSLRTMNPGDREWLVAVTYPHLQDSCRRGALGEVRMILNDLAGVDCFIRRAATPPAAAATDGRTQAAAS